MKQSYIRSTSLQLIDVDDVNHLLSNDEIYLGTKVVSVIESIMARPINVAMQNKWALVNEFKDRCRSFLQVFCKELRKRFDFDDPVMKTIGILKPNIVLSPDRLTNTPTLQALTSKLPRCVGNLDVQTIGDEYGVKLVYTR